MKGLDWHYVARLAMDLVPVLVAAAGKLPLWGSVLPAAATIACLVWLLRSARHVVHEDQPLARMRQDERTQGDQRSGGGMALCG